MKFVSPRLLVPFALLVLAHCYFYEKWYYRELHEVQDELRKIPGIRVEASGGNEDVTLEDVYVQLRVRSGDRLYLSYLTKESFNGKKPFYVSQLGELFPHVTTYGYAGVIQSAIGKPVKTVGSGNAFQVGDDDIALCCPRIRSVPDLIDNYAAVKNEVASWPRCPAYRLAVARDGTIYRFCVASSRGDDGPAIPREWDPECP